MRTRDPGQVFRPWAPLPMKPVVAEQAPWRPGGVCQRNNTPTFQAGANGGGGTVSCWEVGSTRNVFIILFLAVVSGILGAFFEAFTPHYPRSQLLG